MFRSEADRSDPYFVKFLAFYAGGLGCFLAQRYLHASPILAAAALGFLITFLPVPKRFDPKGLQIAFCTGTFVGMSSSQIFTNPWQLLAVSFFGMVIYALARPYATGLGGRMGAIAFLATACWLMVRVWL